MDHAVAQHQVVLHVGAAQVQHTVCQARGFRQVVVIQLEWRRDGGVEHHEFVAQDFNLSALQTFVDGSRWAGTHQAFNLNAEFVAQAFGGGKHFGAIRVAHHLHIPFAITQIDKDHATMVAAAIHPAAQGNGFAHLGFGHQTAIVGAHGHSCLSRHYRFR